MAIRSFGKADRGVQVSRWDPLPQGSPGGQSADSRQGDGSIPTPGTKCDRSRVVQADVCGTSHVGSIPTGHPIVCWEVAQLAEQWILVPPVLGSIPSLPAIPG